MPGLDERESWAARSSLTGRLSHAHHTSPLPFPSQSSPMKINLRFAIALLACCTMVQLARSTRADEPELKTGFDSLFYGETHYGLRVAEENPQS